MRIPRALLAVFICCTAARAADWLNEGGNPQRTGWQKQERAFSPASIQKLRLIWKRKLEGASGPTAPLILGRLITYRGTVELVFVASASGDVYAVDVDFGKIFWKRRLQIDSESSACGPASAATPVLTPLAPNQDEDDDAQQPVRPLYVLTIESGMARYRDGVLKAISE